MKKNLLTYFFTMILIANLSQTFALDCTALTGTGQDDPDPRLIVCIANRVVNTMLLLLGVFLVGIILYGTLKMSLATGDAKRLAGARQTWFYGFVGSMVVSGFFALFVIIQNILGVNIFGTPGDVSDSIVVAIERFMDAAGIIY